MKLDELSANIISLDSRIRFAGVIDRSGRMYASKLREGVEKYLNEKNTQLSFAQTAYIVDLRQIFSSELGSLQYILYSYEKVKLFSVPVKEHVLVFSTDDSVNVEQLVARVTGYLKQVEGNVVFSPPHDILNSEKKQILRNLYESGVSEEIIAEHLDLDVGTVKVLIEQINV
ncbi:MAG TPA: DUF6659 family protein [Nitrososphaeraceae archaeon]|nr:DUF6659 family protein [Nitrososphaeraceae archaeon]